MRDTKKYFFSVVILLLLLLTVACSYWDLRNVDKTQTRGFCNQKALQEGYTNYTVDKLKATKCLILVHGTNPAKEIWLDYSGWQK